MFIITSLPIHDGHKSRFRAKQCPQKTQRWIIVNLQVVVQFAYVCSAEFRPRTKNSERLLLPLIMGHPYTQSCLTRGLLSGLSDDYRRAKGHWVGLHYPGQDLDVGLVISGVRVEESLGWNIGASDDRDSLYTTRVLLRVGYRVAWRASLVVWGPSVGVIEWDRWTGDRLVGRTIHW